MENGITIGFKVKKQTKTRHVLKKKHTVSEWKSHPLVIYHLQSICKNRPFFFFVSKIFRFYSHLDSIFAFICKILNFVVYILRKLETMTIFLSKIPTFRLGFFLSLKFKKKNALCWSHQKFCVHAVIYVFFLFRRMKSPNYFNFIVISSFYLHLVYSHSIQHKIERGLF